MNFGLRDMVKNSFVSALRHLISLISAEWKTDGLALRGFGGTLLGRHPVISVGTDQFKTIYA
jgi:hypothetical protein